MPKKSYYRFENTALALSECATVLNEMMVWPEECIALSNDELSAAIRLAVQCQVIIDRLVEYAEIETDKALEFNFSDALRLLNAEVAAARDNALRTEGPDE